MKKIRLVILTMTMLLGMIWSVKTVQADSFSEGPNIGDYVYEDKEYITNEQYKELVDINRRINVGVNPQKLYIAISTKESDLDDM